MHVDIALLETNKCYTPNEEVIMSIYDLITRIANEPSLLFLGQSIMGMGESNPFLVNANKSICKNIIPVNELTYTTLFEQLNTQAERVSESESTRMSTNQVQQLQSISDNIQPPEYLQTIMDLHWNSIITSNVDTVLNSAYSNAHTTTALQSVYWDSDCKQDYLSKKNLHCTYLYGNVLSDSRTPPVTYEKMLEASNIAAEFLSRIPRYIKGYGLIVIDGWDPETDWVSLDDLLSKFVKFQKNSVFIFSAPSSISQNRIVRLLQARGILTLEPQSLYECMFDAGLISSEQNGGIFFDDNEDGISITIENIINGAPKPVLHHLSYDIYNQLDKAISVLDDSILSDTEYIDREEFFLRFLSTGNGTPFWGGYPAKFYFQRDIDNNLLHTVQVELEKSVLEQHIILVEGQTGSGKTATLGNLAFRLKAEKKYPVIYINGDLIEQDTYQYLSRLINNFFKDKMGCRRTIIIWDKNTYDRDDIYHKLKKDLEESNVLIIGSRFALDDNSEKQNEKSKSKNKNSPIVLKLKEDLSSPEIKRLRSVLESINPLYSQSLDQILATSAKVASQIKKRYSSTYSFNDSGNWFFMIMNRLFEGLDQIQRKGVACEASKAEDAVAQILKKYEMNLVSCSPFAALSTLYGEDEQLQSDRDKGYREKISKISNVLAVCGKFGIPVPLSLLLRIFEKNQEESFHFVRQLAKDSMVRVIENENGVIVVYFRHMLEAVMYLSICFENAKAEIEGEMQALKLLIDHTNFYDDLPYDGGELNTIVSLVRKFGPNGPEGNKYRSYYTQISQWLENCHDAEVILIRCHLLREAFVYNDPNPERLSNLKIAQQLLRQTIAKLNEKLQVESKQMARLRVELASNLLQTLPNDKLFTNEQIATYWEIHENLTQAKNIDFSLQSVDVYLHATLQMYEMGCPKDKSTKAYRRWAELLGEMLELIEDLQEFRPEYTAVSSIEKSIWRVKVHNKNAMDLQAYYDALIAKGSDTGLYLEAMRVLGDYNFQTKPTAQETKAIERAIKILQSHPEITNKKPRLLYLLIRLLWINKTAEPFYKEKQRPRFTEDDWSIFNKLCAIYTNLEDSKKVALPYFIQAIYQFIYGRDSLFKKFLAYTRLYAYASPAKHITYIQWCDENGNPQLIDATIRSKPDDKHRFEAILEGGKHNGTTAYFTERNFKKILNLKDGQSLGKVCVGFNLYSAVIFAPENWREVQ